MSWFQYLRDDFTLRPFEIQQTHSDSAAMASGTPDVTTNQEPAEVQEECSGKKKSKFQTFKRFFARKKRKDPSAAGADASLKASQSSDNVSKASESNTLTRAEKDKGSGSKISLGGKALSHDSVFVSDSSEANEALGASQDSLHGKVKSLQLQLKQAIKLGSPPSLMCVKRAEDPATMSEDDGLPCSPPEYTTVHTNQAQANSSISLEGIDSDEDRRTEGKAGQESEMEAKLTTSTPLQDQQEAEEVADVLLKPEVEREENEEESEETDQPQHSIQSLLGDEEEGEDESDAEQDVSHDPDTSSPPEPSHSEEEDSDSQPLPSSKLSSSASSLDSPRATPEPPSGLTDTSMASSAAESKDVSDSASESEEDGLQNHGEEENSFLQEVLSSLKTPLVSASLDMKTEGAVLEMKEEEVKEKEEEEVEMEEGEEVKEEEEEVDESLNSQAAPSCSMLSDQTTKEEEQVVTSLWQEEEEGGVDAEEETEEEEEEEEPAVERFIRSDDEEKGEEQAVEVKPEEDDSVLSCQTISQAGDDNVEQEDGESEGGDEEEAIKLEKSEMEEEGREMREEDEEVETTERTEVEEAEEAEEGEERGAEEMPEMLPDTPGEEVQVVAQEVDEGVALEGDAVCAVKLKDDDQIPAEMSDQGLTTEQKEQDFNQNSGDETEEGEDTVEEGADLSVGLDQSAKGVGGSQSDADQSEQELESEEATPQSDTKQMEECPSEAAEQDDGSPEPPPLSLQSPKSEARSPTKTSTAIVHINLVSPSSEKATSLFQLPPAAADSSDSASEAASHDTESTSADKEEADGVEEEEEEEETHQDAASPAPTEEKTSQPPCSPDHTKVRFTIAPAWQRSQSLNPPPSPPASISSPFAVAPSSCEEPETVTEDSVTKAEPATSPKVELVLSPSRVKTAKPQSSVTPAPPKISTSASIEESSVIVEGNPDNPFGVRLRKTSALLRFSSEEENTEPPTESQTQPPSSKVDSPQPVSVKPSICPPVSIKPALPKKPEVQAESGGKLKRVSDSVAGRAVSTGSDPPSWISVAKQKQKIYKENSLEEITVKKEDQERKSSLPTYVCSAASKEQGTKTAETKGKGAHLEMSKPSVSPDKEARRPFSPPTPVPPQPLKSQPLPCVAPKPYVPPPQAKYPPQPNPPQRCLSTPDAPKSPATPSSPSKTPPPLTCSPFPSRTASEKPVLRAPGLPGQTPPSQRNLPPTTLAQDEPPWMALAKKKAKAWSEMPQIVQ
uniref:Zgc:66433 n=1 Tax=Haplochromis burtoni TaxID=8153 RepID=A0A3Q2VGG2_HAPBU